MSATCKITRAERHSPVYCKRSHTDIAHTWIALLISLGVSTSTLATTQLIVRFSDPSANVSKQLDQDKLQSIANLADTNVKHLRVASGGFQVIELDNDFSASELTALSKSIYELDTVLLAEPDRRYQPQLVPNDPGFDRQWYLDDVQGGIDAVSAWDLAVGSSNTIIAVLDTGILPHSDYAGRYLAGYDFISDLFSANDGDGRDANTADPGDAVQVNDCAIDDPIDDIPSSWHGTLIAGLIASNTDNGIGIAGIDHRAKILPVRVLGRCGGFSSDVADAIRWAAGISDPTLPPDNPNPADIINVSFGGVGSCTAAEQAAIDAATAAGALVVAAAGNSALDVELFTPANCNNVLTVAATTRQGGETCYTNFGEGIHISAPGGNSNDFANCSGRSADGIYSTSNSGTSAPATESFDSVAGTSFAAPMVAATAALVHSINPSLQPTDIITILQSSARSFPSGTTDSFGDCNTERCGSGLLDAHNAVLIAREDALNVLGTGTIQMALAQDCVLEDFSTVQLEIERLSGTGAVAVRVITERISAAPGIDFGTIDRVITWADDDFERKLLTVPIIPDSAVEGAEFFTTGIIEKSINAEIGDISSTTVTIVSSDGNSLRSCADTETSTDLPTPPVTNTSGGGAISLIILFLPPLVGLRRHKKLF